LTRLRLLVGTVAIAAAAVNFLLIRWMLGFGFMGRTLIPGLADFSPTYNHGVSFGLLTPDGATGRHLLIALLAVITLAVAAAAWRTTTMLTAMGYALILGGALGNLSDRLLNDGAVFDFLALHLGHIPLFICNFPDIVITAGVILLFAGLLFEERGAKGVAA